MKNLQLLFFAAILAQARSLDPKSFSLFKLPAAVWPTYNGDDSGRCFSDLDQINQGNVEQLKIEWLYRIQGIGSQRGVGAPTIKSTPLVNGILYFTIPDHVFAIDAHTGELLWQYDSEDHGGHLVGQRGVGMYGAGSTS
jgi:glucose dehydrogenase